MLHERVDVQLSIPHDSDDEKLVRRIRDRPWAVDMSYFESENVGAKAGQSRPIGAGESPLRLSRRLQRA